MIDSVRFGPANELGVTVEDAAKFYSTHWERPIALSLPEFYRWQFVDTPEARGKDFSSVAVRNDELLGIMGCTPRGFLLDGILRKGAEITTWVVKEEARGKGLGRGIIADLQERYDVLIALGIGRSAIPLFMISGFSYMSRLPRFFRVLDLASVEAIAEFDGLGRRLAERPLSFTDSYQVSGGTPAELAEIASSIEKDTNLYIRDEAYLRWRFIDHPVFNYELFVVSGNGAPVAVVTRNFEVKGIRIVFIADIFGHDRGMPGAIRFVEDFARQRRATFIDVNVTNSRTARHLRNAQWFSATDDYWFRLPHLFYPIQMREPQTTSAAVWARHKNTSIFDFSRLHLTKSDIDLDRPTLAYYEQHGVPL